MIVYSIGCFLAVILTNIVKRLQLIKSDNKRVNKNEIIVAFLSGLPLIIISSIRYNVGQDYLSYMHRFVQISNGKSVDDFEYLFFILNKIISAIGGNYIWLFAITSTIFVTFSVIAIMKDSPYPELSVFLLVTTTYYFSSMNGIRQMIACSILLFSLRFIERKKIICFFASVLIAIGFHTSSLLFLFVYFIYDMCINKRTIIISTVLVFVFSKVISTFINYITSLSKYNWYLNSIYAESKNSGYITMMIAAVIVIFALFYYDEKSKKFQLYLKLQVISLWLSFFVDQVPLIQRVKWIFGLPVIILIPLIIGNIKDIKTRRYITILVVTLYFVYFIYSVGINNSNAVLPYNTIF